jgi:hypothetical protein
VATLHEVLLKSNPAIAEDAVIQFRSGLVFIINRLHDEGAEGIQPSLLDQAKLLDDEGYDSHTLLTILNKVTEATIGSSATQELLSYIQENAAELDGLPFLLDHVHASFPELARAIDELETLAIEEENQLLAMAGGMSKKVEVPLIAGAVLGGSVLGIGVAVAGYRRRRSMLAERAVRDEQAVKDEVKNDLSSEAIMRYWVKANKASLAREAISKGADRDTINAIIENPDHAIKQSKSIEDYVVEDVEFHATQLALAHIHKFESALEGQVEVAFENELNNIDRSIRNSGDFKLEVKSRLEKIGYNDIKNLSWENIKELPEYNETVDQVLNVGSWRRTRLEQYIENSGSNMNAMKNVFDKIKDSYAIKLQQEITSLKENARIEVEKTAEERLADGLWDIDEESNYMRKAELKLDSDIVSKAEEAQREISANAQAALRRGESVDSLF